MTSQIIQYNSISDVMTVARTLLQSGFLPASIKTEQQAFAIITLGQELGLTTWQALNGINVIQGKPTVSPQLMLGMINRSGLLEDMTVEDGDTFTTVTLKRKGRVAYSYTFTDSDAQAMGLLGKDNWRKQKATMRRWRAINGAERVVFPDVVNGMYPPEEIDPDTRVNEDGEIVVSDAPLNVTNVPATPPQTPPAPTPPSVKNGCWTKEEASAFAAKWKNSDDMTPQDILMALCISKFSEWCDGEAAADEKIRDFLIAEAEKAATTEPPVETILAKLDAAAAEMNAENEATAVAELGQWSEEMARHFTTDWHTSKHKFAYSDLCRILGVDDLLELTCTVDDANQRVEAWIAGEAA